MTRCRARIIFAYYEDISELPCSYTLPSDHARKQTISLARIVPTQPYVLRRIVNNYLQKIRMVDGEGYLPFGIRFVDSNVVYLVDGHHRWCACAERGRRRMRLWVDEYPYSLDEAMQHTCGIAPPGALPDTSIAIVSAN